MYIDLPEKNYYKIGEVAKAFNVNSSLIRFWEKEFDILQPRKNRKGDRMFSKEDIEVGSVLLFFVKASCWNDNILFQKKDISSLIGMVLMVHIISSVPDCSQYACIKDNIFSLACMQK